MSISVTKTSLISPESISVTIAESDYHDGIPAAKLMVCGSRRTLIGLTYPGEIHPFMIEIKPADMDMDLKKILDYGIKVRSYFKSKVATQHRLEWMLLMTRLNPTLQAALQQQIAELNSICGKQDPSALNDLAILQAAWRQYVDTHENLR